MVELDARLRRGFLSPYELLSANVAHKLVPETSASASLSAQGAHITIRGLQKAFNGIPVYESFDLELPRGRITSIFGPNGCGKSTLINMMAGIIPVDAGQIRFGGKTISQTKIGYVFQNYRDALFPWLRGTDNITYPLKLAGVPVAEANRRLERLVGTFDIQFDLHSYPYQLSGGQQQTISIMRALILEPEVLFLDEPFSALDYEMTLLMRDQLQRVLEETRTTSLLVSHDLEEAVYLADKLLLLTRRPTRVAAFMDVPIRRPRHPETTTDAAFTAIKADALAIFQSAVRSGLPQ